MFSWAITRARADALRVAEALCAAGVSAFALPCIERLARPIETWAPSGLRVGFFTSAGAVDAVAASLPRIALGLTAAVAPTTRDALVALGRGVDIVASDGALGLARATLDELSRRDVSTAHFWYPTSDVGKRRAEQEEAVRALETRGDVTRVVAYQTRAPASLSDDVQRLPSPYGVVFTSPSTVEHFVAAQPASAPARVACWGASTLSAARLHFPDAVELNRDHPLSESLAALEPRHV